MESVTINWLTLMLMGASGGVVNYLYCLKRDLFKNNKLVRKFFCDFFGGALIAPIFASIFSDTLSFIIAFGSGLCWARITQITRKVLTDKIEKRLKKMG